MINESREKLTLYNSSKKMCIYLLAINNFIVYVISKIKVFLKYNSFLPAKNFEYLYGP